MASAGNVGFARAVSQSSAVAVEVTVPFGFKAILILSILCLAAYPALAVSTFAVRPPGACTYSGNGANWSCAASSGAAGAYVGLPSTLQRGSIYYLADGSYGSHLALSQADSGTATIELRKAQSYDYGGMSGFTASTMGAGQAVWSWAAKGSMVTISSDYWTINGNGNNMSTSEVGCGGVQANPPATMLLSPPNPAACGIKIDASTCNSTATNGCDGGSGEMHGGGVDITWENVEWKGQGLNSNGNNNSETYFWFATPTTNMIVTKSYLHNAGTTYITNASGGWNNGTVSYNYFWGLFDGSTNHGEALQDTGSDSGTAIHHNIFRDQANTNSTSLGTNGDLVFVDPVTGTHNAFLFYNNVDFCSQGVAGCVHHDGFIACINSSQTCTNFVVMNNTFVGITNNAGIVSTNTGSYLVENNLWYNCASASVSSGGATQSHNSFLNTQGSSGATNVNITSGAPNPFVSWPTGNFQLVSDSADWNNRASLGAPYDTADLYGNPFSTDRGAAQYGSASVVPPTAPSVTTAIQ